MCRRGCKMWLKVSTEDVVKMDDVRMTVSQDDARMMVQGMIL